ncbi:MAG: aminotransferase class V-fold PLP-dependent enzyme [Chloroflexi bacterium]|nr:aminotransferase class V-fold PLP-dependent enzyme [Chloroflexota bacterium]
MGIYEKLGVRTMINAGTNGTANGGSIMYPEVLAAMQEASRNFIDMSELLAKAGQRIADLVGVEACYITSGAAGGVLTSIAACMTGKDWAKVHQLPNTQGMKNEVILQVMQRNFYELMVRESGAKLVEIGLANLTYPWHLEAAINERTLAIIHFVAYSPPQDLPLEEVIKIAKKHSIPVIVDAASEFPPFSNLRKYIDMGADLAVFSGGKGIRGPQSSGLILGRKDLIEACAMNGSPFHGVGRPCKVGKEEIIGLLTAVELFSDPKFERRERDGRHARMCYIAEALSNIPHVTVRTGTTRELGVRMNPGSAFVTVVDWDQAAIPLTKQQAVAALLDGEPGIWVGTSLTGIAVGLHTLQPGEERIVAARIREVLTGKG